MILVKSFKPAASNTSPLLARIKLTKAPVADLAKLTIAAPAFAAPFFTASNALVARSLSCPNVVVLSFTLLLSKLMPTLGALNLWLPSAAAFLAALSYPFARSSVLSFKFFRAPSCALAKFGSNRVIAVPRSSGSKGSGIIVSATVALLNLFFAAAAAS